MSAVGAVLGASPLVASAQAERTVSPEAPLGVTRDVPEAPRNYLNLRVGGTSFNPTHPEICVEGSPLRFLAFEMCGTGSGFLHQDPAPEIAHFRGKYLFRAMQLRSVWLQPAIEAGFAELQVGQDGSGFQFGGTGVDGVETAGPELGFGLKALIPTGDLFELVGELNVSGAWFPHAPELVVPMSSFQPTATFTLGVGF